jgi:hypothetical protein
VRRLFLFLVGAGACVAAAMPHRAEATGVQATVCLVNGSNTPGVLDQTRVVSFGTTTSTFHTRTVYYAGRFTTVDASAVEHLMAQGRASFGSPLTEAVQENLGNLTVDFQDTLLTFPFGFLSTTYDNTDLEVRNADCYWSAAE